MTETDRLGARAHQLRATPDFALYLRRFRLPPLDGIFRRSLGPSGDRHRRQLLGL